MLRYPGERLIEILQFLRFSRLFSPSVCEASYTGIVISGAHIIVYSKDAEADRAFVRDVLGFASVDAGHGWLIFALPPAEAAFHPAEDNNRH